MFLTEVSRKSSGLNFESMNMIHHSDTADVTQRQPVTRRQDDELSRSADPGREADQRIQAARVKLSSLLVPFIKLDPHDPDFGGQEEEDDVSIEDAVADYFKGPNLDLDRRSMLDFADSLFEQASSEVWEAINELNKANGEPALVACTLHRNFPPTKPLLIAMDRLGVRHLTMQPPDGAEIGRSAIDGSAVRLIDLTSHTSLQTLLIDGDTSSPLWIAVSGDVTVKAQRMSEPALLKSSVCFFDAEDNVMVRPLYGQIHERRALEFRQGDEDLNAAAQIRALTAPSLNGAAPPLTLRRADDTVDEVPMDCRMLTGITLNVMVEREAQRARGLAVARLAYDLTATPEAITATASAGLVDDLARMYSQGSCAIFETSQMGRALIDECRSLPPGQSRFFVLSTPMPHYMGLALRHKVRPDGKPEFVVKLYDSNISTHHQRDVVGHFSALEEMDLKDWLGRGLRQNTAMFMTYFPKHPRLASLFRWPAANGPAQLRQYVTDASLDSPELLNTLMVDGHAAEVSQWIARQVGNAASLAPDELMRRLAGCGGAGLFSALASVAGLDQPQDHPYCCGRPEAVRAYVHSVLAVPAHLLDSGAKFGLLWEYGTAPQHITAALQGASIDTAMAIVEEVLGARGALTPEQQRKVLFPDLGKANKNLLPALRQRLASEPRADVKDWLDVTIQRVEGAS